MNHTNRALVFTGAALFSLITGAQEVPLEEGLGDCEGKRAYVLVGGFGESWHYFEPWVEELRRAGGCIFGFESDYTKVSMPKTSEQLRDELWGLQDMGFTDVTILAHSMGGLVSRRALQLTAQRTQSNPLNVTLHAFGTPWGGFFWANFARWTPGGRELLTAMGYPMSADIGSSASFMRALREPLPATMSVVVHNSEADEVSRPDTFGARENFAAIVQQSKEVRTYANISHSDFVHQVEVQF